MSIAHLAADEAKSPLLAKLSQLAPRPTALEASGVPAQLLADLLLKFISRVGPLSAASLCDRLALANSVLEPVFQYIRREGYVDIQSRADSDLAFALTARGREAAVQAFERNGYVGPAPVPVSAYRRLVHAQSVHQSRCTRERMEAAFSDVILEDEVRDRLGTALNSGRAIFVHGPAGAGKTFISTQLINALTGEVLIPYAILVDDTIIRVYDSSVHEQLDLREGNPRLLHGRGYDARYVLCDRPLAITGGELVPEMLDVQFRNATREFIAPIQMKANNGLLLVDDLGRQRFPVQVLFDRWIIPMERQTDYLSAGAGLHFAVPFDLVLVFSTNLAPAELADDAVLRRLGYKIEFKALPASLYKQVWEGVCREMRLNCDASLADQVIRELYPRSGCQLLACHPRDLLRMAMDRSVYDGRPGEVDLEDLRWAWSNYFLNATHEHSVSGH